MTNKGKCRQRGPRAGKVGRRGFLKATGAGLAMALFGRPQRGLAADSAAAGISHFVPAGKDLAAEWLAALGTRGAKEVFRGEALNYVGMPVGGIGAGELYLCGDGTLGCWELFNRHAYRGTGENNYAGRVPDKPVDQGFAVVVEQDGRRIIRTLSREAFADVEFTGTYPIGTIRYRAEDFPVEVQMEAFSPFIPLNAQDSALPATVFAIKIMNRTNRPLRAACLGWVENPVCVRAPDDFSGTRRTARTMVNGRTIMTHSAEEAPQAKRSAERPPIMLQNFEGQNYGAWQTEGEAFGTAPARGALPWQEGLGGFEGNGLANSFLRGDSTTGTLTSPPFTVERRYINFLVGGGNFANIECVNLLIDGKVVATATGNNDEQLRWETWKVESYEGRQARIEIVDKRPYPFGHICVDQIEMSDVRRKPFGPIATESDFGTMTLALAEEADTPEAAAEVAHMLPGAANRRFSLADDTYPFPERRNAALVSSGADLAPGAERTFSFVLAWHFPNAAKGHLYATRFRDATTVANYVLDNLDRLAGDTRRWRDTYYDSTLPFWLLDRLHSTVSTLATGTCQWWANGRFWAYEGVVSCPGTCTHVWNYAQAEARLFPELARSVREMQDFNPDGGGYHPDTGLVGFRGDHAYAADGQCGTVLKAYRDHQLSADRSYLDRNWPKIKKALEYCLKQDGNGDGLIENEQPNTYDFAFQGANTFVGSLYLAALRAGEEMAREQGDNEFAEDLKRIFESGKRLTVERLWDGEYFIQDVDLAKFPANQYGRGCLTDQLFGQAWAHELGLGHVYPPSTVKTALEHVWKYNWAPDVEPQNRAHPPLRRFALPGEAGMFVVTWPKTPYLEQAIVYKNEVWTGSEYQVAGNMIRDGLVEKGLAVCRAIHERYHPSKRNPYNEVECGDHYARALASWGVFTALCGFEYHGPQQHIGFAPRLTPESFKAAFTTAEGWGSFSQRHDVDAQRVCIEVSWGRLTIKTLALSLDERAPVKSVTVKTGDGPVKARHTVNDGRLEVVLETGLTVKAGQIIEVIVNA